jgi:hypothetical protein
MVCRYELAIGISGWEVRMLRVRSLRATPNMRL